MGQTLPTPSIFLSLFSPNFLIIQAHPIYVIIDFFIFNSFCLFILARTNSSKSSCFTRHCPILNIFRDITNTVRHGVWALFFIGIVHSQCIKRSPFHTSFLTRFHPNYSESSFNNNYFLLISTRTAPLKKYLKIFLMS